MSAEKNLDWMLWEIDKKQKKDPPVENLIRAIQYYNEKYGQVPNRCEISKRWAKKLEAPGGITITRSKSVRPHQLMLTLDPSLNPPLPIKRSK